MASLKIVPPLCGDLAERRNKVAMEASFQIEALMSLVHLAEQLGGEEHLSAVRSIAVRAQQLNRVVIYVLAGDPDEGIGDWEITVCGALQGEPTGKVDA